jgi:hypothetical protein
MSETSAADREELAKEESLTPRRKPLIVWNEDHTFFGVVGHYPVTESTVGPNYDEPYEFDRDCD